MEQSSIPPKKRKSIHEAVGLIGGQTVASSDYSVVRIDMGITLPRDNTLLKKTRDTLLKEGANLLLFEKNDRTSISVSSHTELDFKLNISSHGEYTPSTLQNNSASRGRKKYLDRMDDHKQGGRKYQANSLVKDEYLIVPDISVANSDITIGGDRCRNSTCGFGQRTRYKWCYIDWSDNWEYRCTDKCRASEESYPTCEVGNGRRPCSLVLLLPLLRCAPGHECGLHNNDYFWCYTDTNKNWEKCCHPWHTCSKYGGTEKFCFTGKSKETLKEKCFY